MLMLLASIALCQAMPRISIASVPHHWQASHVGSSTPQKAISVAGMALI